MGSFYAPTCKTGCLQILYKFCKNWISVPNIVHQLTLSLRCKYWKIHSRSNFQDAKYTLLGRRVTASQWRQSSMTSFRLESVRGRSNMLIEGHFWRFFGKCEPQNVVGHRVDSQKHFLTSQRVFWTIVHEIPCTGYFSRRVRIKNNKREALYFTYFARRSLAADWHKFWVTCSSRGRNQLCKVLS